ncbi:MAG TPA: HAD family hydrolase [Candidatus Paceibacterota bacterium]
MPAIKAVVFDADGVLIHTEPFSVQLERTYGIAVERVLPFFKGVFQEALVGKTDVKDALGPHLRDWGWKGTVDELLTFWFESEHHTDAHMIEIIGSIRGLGIRCFLATNQEQRRVDYMREKMGFGSVFDKLYSSAGIGHLKSDEEFFRIMTDDICENFLPDLQPGEVAFFDDSLGNVEAAQRFGIQASLFTDIEGFQRKLGELGVVMSD